MQIFEYANELFEMSFNDTLPTYKGLMMKKNYKCFLFL